MKLVDLMIRAKKETNNMVAALRQQNLTAWANEETPTADLVINLTEQVIALKKEAEELKIEILGVEGIPEQVWETLAVEYFLPEEDQIGIILSALNEAYQKRQQEKEESEG